MDILNSAEAVARKVLLQHELARCLAILAEEQPPDKVILFGSLAEDKVSVWSDLDLAVICQTDLPFLDRSKAMLKRLRPRVGMDVLVYTPEEFAVLCQTRAFLREEILLKGKVVYEHSQ